MTQRIPVRIVSIQGNTIYGVEEDGHVTQVFLTSQQQADPLYLRILLVDEGWL
jgi:hypothetical protein